MQHSTALMGTQKNRIFAISLSPSSAERRSSMALAAPQPERPIVRHEWRRETVTAVCAPAARSSAFPSIGRRDVLVLPGERSPSQKRFMLDLLSLGIAIALVFIRWC
jgi:hypothetical protein